MEKLPTNKRESGISRIAGFDKKSETELLDYFKRQFEGNVNDKYEREHSPELQEMIRRINEKMIYFFK